MAVMLHAQDRLMRTALHWAAEMGHIDAAQTLLDFGADVKLKECTGRYEQQPVSRQQQPSMWSMQVLVQCASYLSIEHNDPAGCVDKGITPPYCML